MRTTPDADICPRCQKCERLRTAPDYFLDPMIIWDRFPCPPPGTDHARLLIELDWTGHMGTKDGCEALRRVARRCHVDLKNFHSLPSSLPDCEEFVDVAVFCGTNCFIAFILAGICLLFFLLLIILCIRYVRRADKQSSPLCSKVLSSERAAVNTHINKDYAQSQYFYRPNGIPDRRGLPCEARMTSSGVEARLLKAIHENQLQQYSTEDFCPQCLAVSRQSTIQCGRNRQGYEIIYWKDGDFFLKRVPSNDTVNRMSFSRDKSLCGSSSNVSHVYEYISDPVNDCSCNTVGRLYNHSAKFNIRNSFQTVQATDDFLKADANRENTIACGSDHDPYTNCRKDWKASRTSITSVHSRYQDRGRHQWSWTEKNLYQPSMSDKGTNQDSICDSSLFQGYYSDNALEIPKLKDESDTHGNNKTPIETKGLREQNMVQSDPETIKSDVVKGYRYVFNPICDEDVEQSVCTDGVDLLELQSELFEIDDHLLDQTRDSLKHKVQHRKESVCSNTSNYSERASINGHFR